MNIQSRAAVPNRRRKDRNKKTASWGGKLQLVLAVILFLGAIFVIANYRISLNQKIAEIQRETAKTEKEIRKLNLELEALRSKRESLSSWSYIRNRIAAYQLPLIQPSANQVQMLVLQDFNSSMPEPKVLFPEQAKNHLAVR